MAVSKDSGTERELRHLRRENKKELEESQKRQAELKAVQAQKEQLQKLVLAREEELRRTQADLLTSFRDLQLSGRINASTPNTQQDASKETRTPELNGQQEDRIVNTPSEQDGNAQLPQTDDIILRQKEQMAKSRRIIYSADDKAKRAEEARKTPQVEHTSPDFSKTMDRAIHSMDKRLDLLREQGFYPGENSMEDKLTDGKEFGGVRRKGKTYMRDRQNSTAEGKSQSYDRQENLQTDRDISGQETQSGAILDPMGDTRKQLKFKDEFSPGGARTQIETDKSYDSIDINRFRPMSWSIPEHVVETVEPTQYLKETLQTFEDNLMEKVCIEIRQQNAQVLNQQQRMIEQSLDIRKKEAEDYDRQFKIEENKELANSLLAREKIVCQREADIARREEEMKMQEPRIQTETFESGFMKAKVIELNEREDWIRQQEETLRDVKSLKDSLLEQKEEMDKKMQLVQMKEKELSEKEEQYRLRSTEQFDIRSSQETDRIEKMLDMISKKIDRVDTRVEERNSEATSSKEKEPISSTVANRDEKLQTEVHQDLRPQLEQTQMVNVTSENAKSISAIDFRTTYIDPNSLKFSPFSGEDPKPKSESSFEEWKYEVDCIREDKVYSPTIIAQAIRKSLRGQAKRVIVPLGVLASLDDIMDRLENVFGNVASGHSILKEFYTATQTETETSSAWGSRLEEIYQRAIDKGKAREEDKNSALIEQFWESLRSERLKNATRVKYESAENFEYLRRAVRAEEDKMKRATNVAQQQFKSQVKSGDSSDDKLDLVLRRLEALEKSIAAGRGRGRGKNWYPDYKNTPPGHRDENSQEQTEGKTHGKEPLNG